MHGENKQNVMKKGVLLLCCTFSFPNENFYSSALHRSLIYIYKGC